MVGITFSAFDLLHAGHVKMLEESRKNSAFLIVGQHTDPTIYRPNKKQEELKIKRIDKETEVLLPSLIQTI